MRRGGPLVVSLRVRPLESMGAVKSASSKSTAVSSRRRAWKLVDTEACDGLVGPGCLR